MSVGLGARLPCLKRLMCTAWLADTACEYLLIARIVVSNASLDLPTTLRRACAMSDERIITRWGNLNIGMQLSYREG
jgi:hypothetical protein